MQPTRQELVGTHGMVSSTHWLASGAGMAALERGGNAFDAAVAAGFVLQVVEPHLNGPGGEVPILGYAAAPDRVFVVNGQGPAPRKASVRHFTSLGLALVPATGLLPACAPGAFDAWLLLLAEHGTLPLRAVMDDAIGYALHGFPLVASAAKTIAGVRDLFVDEWPSSAQTYLARGQAPRAGSVVRNQTLGRTYARILDEAERSTTDRDEQIAHARAQFSRGFVAEGIAEFVERTAVMDDTGRRHHGLLDGDDIAAFEATLEEPLMAPYGPFEVYKTGPWSQGPVLLQQLRLLEGFDLESMPLNGEEYVHTVLECAKLAFADREGWYGDPRFTEVPVRDLLSQEYTDGRRRLVGPSAAAGVLPGAPAGRVARLPRAYDQTHPDASRPQDPVRGVITAPSAAEQEKDTCHVDVADRFGNMVSAVPSGGWLHGSPVIPGLGFCLTTRGQIFWLEAGLPNSLEGGKRPRTTLSPTLVSRDGVPYLAFGTPGGDNQDQWGLGFFLAHAHFGMGLQDAMEIPRFHSRDFPDSFSPRQAFPARVVLEEGMGTEVVRSLQQRGHEVVVQPAWSLGRMCAVSRRPDGCLTGAADPRRSQGYAVGR